MRQKLIFLSTAWMILAGLSACSLPESSEIGVTPIISPTRGGELVQESEQPVATLSPTHIVVFTASPTTAVPVISQVTPTTADAQPCDQAAPGSIIDVTIPDDTVLQPKQSFAKTWRLVNTGSCAWDHSYAIVWFSGENFSASRYTLLSDVVVPGQSVDLTVDMIAPEKPGLYSGYWLLQNSSGRLFGIGPEGNSPFWVRVQVEAPSEPTPAATIVLTATPIVLVQTRVELTSDQMLDLDTGLLSITESSDLSVLMDAGPAISMASINQARLGVYGSGSPTVSDCFAALYEAEGDLLGPLAEDTYLCYRTNQGLPGMLQLTNFDSATGKFTLEIVTWAVP